ncbi:uncharacterized protein LY79DRAFT_591964 [Colletotrichum navitas]|uniref:Uncharacterized protein n=1 Tax=Colletotrichum navitas TaxID=681940 RepID=A0AAD8PVR1_9PEZI|nr:uncharacterized protein LY79DRAFT_591964 [Colletotrichum navitas]KAK1584789.1 hypothetical protein LY79DRAFT_591964 [Colletotrichum navitas]
MHAMGSLASPLKRNASQTFEANHDEQVDRHVALDLGRNPTGPARFIKKPQPKLFYPEAMARDAMRGELVYTPDLKPMMDSIVRDMRSTSQTVGRHLGSNIHYSKMKSILKQSQRAMITLDRYLLSEAFIRTDIWMTNRLQEFFKLVHLYGLEREFRDEYWEKNQQSHPSKIQKLYDSIERPLTHSALDEALADQITNWAKDIMSRSVYVPRADHPIIRSAVAIMNMAEQQPDMLQETPKRVAQIWAAWCLARDKCWAETTYLAAIILDRGAKNQMVAKCFRRENSALLNLVDKGYDEEACRRWQDMHGKCHVIPMPELLSRPVVASLLRASPSSLSLQRTFSSASQLQKTARMAKKTGKTLTKVVPSKVKELGSSSKHQLSPIRPSSGQHSPSIRRLSDVDSTSRYRTPADMVRHLQIHGDSRPKKGHNEEMERRPSEYSKKPDHPEADQPRTKKRKTTTTPSSPVSPLRLQREIRHGASPAPSPATPIAPAAAAGSTTPIPAAVPSPALIPSKAPLDMAPIPVAAMSAPAPMAATSASTPMTTMLAPIPVATMSAPPPTPTDPTSQWSNQPVSADDIATLVAMKLRSGPSGLPFTSQPVATKAEYESIEETWTKLEARLEKKISPLIRQLDSLTSEVKALGDKQTALEQTLAKHADDQHKSQDKQVAHDENITKKVETLTQLIDDQQTALKQAVIKMDDQYIAVNKRQTAFEQTITDQVDSLSQLVRTLQKDKEELKARVERGQKKRRRSPVNDKTADSITCAPFGEVASAAGSKCD